MSPKRKVLDLERTRKALENDQEALRRNEKMRKLSIERNSLLERTEKLTIEEGSLTSQSMEYMESVIDDYRNDLQDLENSIKEYRLYIKRLRDREKAGL